MADINLRISTDHAGAVTGLGLVSGKLDKVADSADKSQAKVSAFDSVLQGIGQGAGQAIFSALADGASLVADKLFDVVSRTVDTGGNLADLSAKTGVAAEGLQTLEYAGDRAGVGLDTITDAIGKMQQGLVNTPEKFDAVGLSARELINMEPDAAFQRIAERLAEVENPAQRAALAVELLGKGGKAILPMVGDMAELRDRAKELGYTLAESTVAAADKLGDTFGDLQKAWGGLFTSMGAGVVESAGLEAFVNTLAEGIGDLSNWIKANREAITEWVDSGVLLAIDGLEALLSGVDIAIEAWDRLSAVAYADARALLGFGETVVLTAELVGALTDGLGALNDDGFDPVNLVLDVMKTKMAEAGFIVAVLGSGMAKFGAVVADIAGKDDLEQRLRAEALAFDKLQFKLEEAGRKAIDSSKATETHGRATDAFRQKLEEVEKRLREAIDSGQEHEVTIVRGAAAHTSAKEKAAEHAKAIALLVQELDEGERAAKELSDMVGDQMVAAFDRADKAAAAAGQVQVSSLDMAIAVARQEIFVNIQRAEQHLKVMEIMRAEGLVSKEALAEARKALADLKQEATGDTFAQQAGKAAKFAEGLLGLVNTIHGLGAAWDDATDSASGFERTMGGAMLGMEVGGEIGAFVESFGVPGAEAAGKFVGGLVGAIGGLFSGDPEWVESGREAGEIFGHAISEELARIIQQDMDDLGLTAPEAALLHISEAMDEGGAEARMYADDVQSLMQGIADGSIPAKEGLEQVGEMFTRIQTEAEEAGRVGDRALVAILESARATGTMTEEMQGFVDDRIAMAIAGMEQFAEGLSHMDGEWGSQGKDASTIFLATFDATIKEQGLFAALEALGPSFELLRDKFEDEGDLASLAFLGPFARLHDLMSAEDGVFAGAVSQAEGLGDVLVGLADSGYMTEAAFGAIGSQLQAVFTTLSESGATSDEALQAILPTLGDAVSAAEQYGYELDGATQSLVDQAEAAGYSFPEDPMLAMVDLLGQIVVLMGGELPAAGERARAALTDSADQAAAEWETSGEAIALAAGEVESGWTDAADAISGSLLDAMDSSEKAVDPLVAAVEAGVDRMNDLKITIPVTYSGGHMALNDDGTPDFDGDPTNSFAKGGVVDAPLTGEPAMLHGKEAITPLEMVYSRMADIVAAKLASASGGFAGAINLNVSLYADRAGSIGDMTPAMASQFRQLIASGLIQIPARAVGRGV